MFSFFIFIKRIAEIVSIKLLMERCAARLQPSAVQCELSAEQKLVTIIIIVLTLVILAVMMKKREQEQQECDVIVEDSSIDEYEPVEIYEDAVSLFFDDDDCDALRPGVPFQILVRLAEDFVEEQILTPRRSKRVHFLETVQVHTVERIYDKHRDFQSREELHQALLEVREAQLEMQRNGDELEEEERRPRSERRHRISYLRVIVKVDLYWNICSVPLKNP